MDHGRRIFAAIQRISIPADAWRLPAMSRSGEKDPPDRNDTLQGGGAMHFIRSENVSRSSPRWDSRRPGALDPESFGKWFELAKRRSVASSAWIPRNRDVPLGARCRLSISLFSRPNSSRRDWRGTRNLLLWAARQIKAEVERCRRALRFGSAWRQVALSMISESGVTRSQKGSFCRFALHGFSEPASRCCGAIARYFEYFRKRLDGLDGLRRGNGSNRSGGSRYCLGRNRLR